MICRTGYSNTYSRTWFLPGHDIYPRMIARNNISSIMCTNISISTPLSRSLIVFLHRFSGILSFCPNRHKPFGCFVVERPIFPSCSAITTKMAKQDLLSACVRYSTPRPFQCYHRRAIRTAAARIEVSSEQHPTEPKPDISTGVGSRGWLTVKLEPTFFKIRVPLIVAGGNSSNREKTVFSVSATARGDRVMVITDVIAEQPRTPASCIANCCDNQCHK